MKILRNTIIGTGLSSLIRDQILKNAYIFCNNKTKIKQSARFYEFDALGGNSNVWGGYINTLRHNKYLKKQNYYKFFKKNNLFTVEKLFLNKIYHQVSFIKNIKNNNIFRINEQHFKNKIKYIPIIKIKILKNYIKIFGKNQIFFTKNLDICAGNLGLIEILYNSKLIIDSDLISFEDGSVKYKFNITKNYKKNYYIPMKLNEILIKLFFKRVKSYKKNLRNPLILQVFEKKSKKYKFKVKDIINSKNKKLRYFLSNHLVKLKINGVFIDEYIFKISKRIKIFNSGKLRSYYAGPISQEIIFNALNEN